MDSKRTSGIIEADIPSINLPNCNAWTYLLPFLKKWSHHTFLVCGQSFKSYTYRQAYEASLRWAHELQQYFQGETPPVVAVLCPNFVEYMILYLGCLAAGAPFCPTRHEYKEDLVFHMLKETKTSVVIVHPSLLETYRKVFAENGSGIKVYVAGPNPLNSGEKNVLEILCSDNKMMDEEKAKQVDPESNAILTFSSGTTGMPKAILLSQKGQINNAACFSHPSMFPVKMADESFQDTVLLPVSLAHAYGLLFTVMAALPTGCRIIVADPNDLLNMLKIMVKYKPTTIVLNPFAIDRLSKMTDLGTSFDSVRTIVNIGSKHNPVTFKELNEKTTKRLFLQECYGSSEMGVTITTPMEEHFNGRPGLTGKLVPNTKARLLDTITGEPVLEPYKNGELLFNVPSLMKGYLNKPEQTKEVLVDGEWFRTGDIGYYDEDRFFYISDRLVDVMSVKGKQVFPSHVEKIIKSHGSVLDVGVICAPNMKTGEEELRAFVIRHGLLEESEIIKFMEEKAPPEMWLDGGVTFVDSLPRNNLGKMVRKLLRRMTWKRDNEVVAP